MYIIQSNLDYPDFYAGPNLVINIYYSQSRSVAKYFLKLWHWKVQSKSKSSARACRTVSNEEHSNEFWLAQSCVVAKSEISWRGKQKARVMNVIFMIVMSLLKAQAMCSFH